MRLVSSRKWKVYWVDLPGFVVHLNCLINTEITQEWLFIIEGAITIAVAILVIPLLPDYPGYSKRTFWLNNEIQSFAVSSQTHNIQVAGSDPGHRNTEFVKRMQVL